MEITWQHLSGIVALITLFAACEWRISQRFGSVWRRFDEQNKKVEKTLKEEYVRHEVYEITNQHHTDNIKEIKSDVHAIKVSIEAMSKSLSVLISRGDEK